MSVSKYKYYEVNVTAIVRANNQADAVAAVFNKRGVDAVTLQSDVDVLRIAADEAHTRTATE